MDDSSDDLPTSDQPQIQENPSGSEINNGAFNHDSEENGCNDIDVNKAPTLEQIQVDI